MAALYVDNVLLAYLKQITGVALHQYIQLYVGSMISVCVIYVSGSSEV